MAIGNTEHLLEIARTDIDIPLHFLHGRNHILLGDVDGAAACGCNSVHGRLPLRKGCRIGLLVQVWLKTRFLSLT